MDVGNSEFGAVNVNEIVFGSTTLTPEISVAVPSLYSLTPTAPSTAAT